MRTVNTFFDDINTLKSFCETNKIYDSNNVLLQIFTGVIDERFIIDLLDSIKQLLPNIKIIGSTTDGEICNDKITSKKTVLSFSLFEHTKIKTYNVCRDKSSYQTGKSLVQGIEDIHNAKVAIVFAEGLHTNGDLFLKSLNNYAPNLVIAGGLSGDNSTFTQTFIFTEKGILDNGAVCAILYNDDLIVHSLFSCGWTELGKELTITKAIKNRVYTIDGMTATQIYKKYLGAEIEEQLPVTGVEFPLIINRNGNKIARAVLGKKDDGSLLFAGNIKKGEKVRFGYGNSVKILENSRNLCNELSTYSVESIFVYSCMTRKILLEHEVKNEISPLLEVSKVSGFFSYGEFYYSTKDLNCTSHLFNETMTLLTLSENKNINRNKITFSQKDIHKKASYNTINALSHLIAETTNELNELNLNLKEEARKIVEKNIKQELIIFEQSKMVSMGEMIGNIAHQWRQPLSVISTGITGIKLQHEYGTLTDDILNTTCDNINKNVQYLSKTIDDFRNYIKGDRNKVEFNLLDNITSFLHLVEGSIKNNNINIILNVQDDLIVNGYPNELIQCFMNIFNNAKDALAEQNIENKFIFITTLKQNDNIIIKIKDNAGGISSEVLPKIFEPYFTTKHKSQGTGLGLYMTYNLIFDGMNGSIDVHNREYKYNGRNSMGAEFTIIL